MKIFHNHGRIYRFQRENSANILQQDKAIKGLQKYDSIIEVNPDGLN